MSIKWLRYGTITLNSEQLRSKTKPILKGFVKSMVKIGYFSVLLPITLILWGPIFGIEIPLIFTDGTIFFQGLKHSLHTCEGKQIGKTTRTSFAPLVASGVVVGNCTALWSVVLVLVKDMRMFGLQKQRRSTYIIVH